MININNELSNKIKMQIKLPVPQVGSYRIDYNSLNELEDNKYYDFVVNNNGDLLIGKGHFKLNNKLHTLYFAGRLKIENGKIIYIDNDSGHYSPNKESLYVFYDIINKLGFVNTSIEKEYFILEINN